MQPIKGNTVRLRPAQETDRRAIFEWLATSDVTASMMGPPLFPDVPIVTWDEFCADYGPHFFDGSSPGVEGSYVIEVDGAGVGQVNYEIRQQPARFAELDIWMRSNAYTGHGYGTDALGALVRHLADRYGVDTFLIRPSERNPRAIRAYEKVGFVRTPMTRVEEAAQFGPGEYADSVVMLMRTFRP